MLLGQKASDCTVEGIQQRQQAEADKEDGWAALSRRMRGHARLKMPVHRQRRCDRWAV